VAIDLKPEEDPPWLGLQNCFFEFSSISPIEITKAIPSNSTQQEE
jgi:hypothetical protein